MFTKSVQNEVPLKMNILQDENDGKIIKKRVRTGTRRKQVECNVCLRKMRSDNLKRHMLKHRELHIMDEDETCNEIKRRKELHVTRQGREQLMR